MAMGMSVLQPTKESQAEASEEFCMAAAEGFRSVVFNSTVPFCIGR